MDSLMERNVNFSASAFLALFNPPEAIFTGDRAEGIVAWLRPPIATLGRVAPEDCFASFR